MTLEWSVTSFIFYKLFHILFRLCKNREKPNRFILYFINLCPVFRTKIDADPCGSGSGSGSETLYLCMYICTYIQKNIYVCTYIHIYRKILKYLLASWLPPLSLSVQLTSWENVLFCLKFIHIHRAVSVFTSLEAWLG